MMRLLAVLCCIATPASAAPQDLFASRIAPLLSRRCVGCHNATKKSGGLDLSTRKTALVGGDNGAVIVPRSADKSKIIKEISGPRARMPRGGTKLTPGEVAQVRRWIDTGANWPADVTLKPINVVEDTWWSLRPLKRPPFPAVKDKAWARTPIDAFILAKLESLRLGPAPEADRRTLLRRVTFDLTGLPPTPAEVAAFIEDNRPGAYQRVVDRLLASPAHGERWGRHWLDVAHYGDTHGYDKDKRRDHAWPYRDWVIRNLNADLPYRDFIERQIAGDVLKPGDKQGIIATGFIVAGPWDFVGHVELREGTVDKEKTRVLDRDDMVSNTLGTFVSMTVGCARCHDHKFDPISQKDYYRLQAVFSGVERGPRWLGSQGDDRKKIHAELAKLTAAKNALQAKIAKLSSPELKKLEADLIKKRRDLAKFALPLGAASPTNGYHSAIMPKPEAVKWVQVDLGSVLPLDELRLFPARPTDFPDSPGFGFPARFRIELSDEPAFKKGRTVADQTKQDYPNPGHNIYPLSLKGQKARYLRITATKLWKRTDDYVFALAELQVDSGGKNIAAGKTVTSLDSIEAGRWSRRHLVDGHDSRHRLPDLNDAKVAGIFRKRLALLGQISQAEARQRTLRASLIPAALRKEQVTLESNLTQTTLKLQRLPLGPMSYAVVPIKPRSIRVLKRGDVEQPKDTVGPGALSCVNGLESEFKLTRPEQEGTRRLALAKWVSSDANMLTWRSIVNRVWHYHFGRGLVDTPSDFGRNGSRPTHPELLDWLAVEFRDKGGSLKALHRLIVTSSVYRQASRHDAKAAKVDADNRYLWRANRRRLDAEEVRDAVLAVSGQLRRTMGGEGYALFRFKDDHSPVYDHADPKAIQDPATYRRTVYRFAVRSVPNPFLDCLDCADPSIHTPVRTATLTALQALALLNNPFMVRQASYFADRLKGEKTTEEQIDKAFRLAMGREPTKDERTIVAAHARKHGLAGACRVLFNLNEFVFVD